MGHPDPGPDADHRPETPGRDLSRRRILLLYLVALAVLFGGLGLLTWRAARKAEADVRTAITEFDAARAGLSAESLDHDAEPTLRHLRGAADRLRAARGHLAASALAPVRLLPFVGRQLRAGIALCDAAITVADAAGDAVARASPALRQASPERLLDTLEEFEGVVRDAAARLDSVRLPTPSNLIRPLRQADLELGSRLAEARQRIHGLAEVLPVLRPVLGANGPRRYFLAVNNNAQMRAAGGMTLSFGILTVDQGRFRLDQVQSFSDLQAPEGSTDVPLPEGSYGNALTWLRPGFDIRNSGVTALFPEAAQVETAIYRSRTGDSVDGVVAVDVVALQDIVAALGSVQVPEIGQTLTADNTVDYLLSRIYRDFVDDNDGRRRVLGHAAQAVATRLEQGGYSYGAVAQRLGGSVRERHVMIWSTRPEEETVLDRAGLAGGFPGDAFPVLAAVQNISANKLDYYLDVAQSLDLRLEGATLTGTLTLDISNPVEVDGLTQYVVGPNENLDVEPGTYRALVSVWLPQGAVVTGVDGDVRPLHRSTDGGYSLVTGYTVIPAGARASVHVGFAMALDPQLQELPLAVLPTGRVRPVPTTVTAVLGAAWDGPENIESQSDGPLRVEWRLRSGHR